ncbi:copper amine oxidase N-terminal domain-containing protein [Neobacillus sp. PS3-12]|uniref:copper amine oxidase N-terminal domain-containing protein n=1 Tax=Neobacillus sp. PS3-12 TaxID=3070677 RepID=UPI0027E0FAE5|nr:copper amine oxidase N-terminal domain-containing protein [Neobacillus sp. PS3-12]WML53038.1 copper amine oxidase N-terminal domain-containing protein [Neobacillus sp. PS3-12]
MPINNPNKTLPITAPSDLSVSVNGNTTKLYFIPQEGQLFVSGEKLANILGAQAQYYPQSKILRITKGQYELIVRADSNAVYENRVKNPMPVKTASYEKTIYLPISVAANALGYRINWDAGSNTIMIESI